MIEATPAARDALVDAIARIEIPSAPSLDGRVVILATSMADAVIEALADEGYRLTRIPQRREGA